MRWSHQGLIEAGAIPRPKVAEKPPVVFATAKQVTVRNGAAVVNIQAGWSRDSRRHPNASQMWAMYQEASASLVPESLRTVIRLGGYEPLGNPEIVKAAAMLCEGIAKSTVIVSTQGATRISAPLEGLESLLSKGRRINLDFDPISMSLEQRKIHLGGNSVLEAGYMLERAKSLIAQHRGFRPFVTLRVGPEYLVWTRRDLQEIERLASLGVMVRVRPFMGSRPCTAAELRESCSRSGKALQATSLNWSVDDPEGLLDEAVAG